MGCEEAINFLTANLNIRNVVLLIDELDVHQIEKIFNNTNIANCRIIYIKTNGEADYLKECLCNDINRGLVYSPKKISFINISDFCGLDDEWTLLSVNCKVKDIIPMLRYNPRNIIGSVVESDITSYKLWELAKDICDHILIKTCRKTSHPVVLDWKKDISNTIELSIILPVYNVGKYIDKCITSITKWDADYIEFIFVSDGSKDESVEIIKQYMDKDSRIHLIEKENGGCASARQRGLEEARGRYVGFVDPDDFVNENMFRRLHQAAMIGSYDISLCGYNEFYENLEKNKKAEDYICQPYLDGCFDKNKISELITFSRVAIWRGIYRKAFLGDNHICFYKEIKRFDDLPFKVETFAFAKSVTMLNEYMYYYRLEREGQDVEANDERLYVHFDIFKLLDQSIGGTGNQRLIDNLQMCKIQTHRYALSKIKKQFMEEYRRRAKEDLLTLCDRKRTYKIAELMLGQEVAKEFDKIVG